MFRKAFKDAQKNRPGTTGNGSAFFKPFVQPKLTVNQPGDEYEQEADAVADRVMRMTDSAAAGPLFFKPAVSSVQRRCAHCEQEEGQRVQRKEVGNRTTVRNGDLDAYVGNLSGTAGQPLSKEDRRFFEPKFGHDFSQVKLHTDSAAAKSSQSISALAYTAGNHIVFNQNQYQPGTDNGKRLLAHELTHVLQQNGGASPRVQRAKIDHKQLAWTDFRGAAPKGENFDAATFSDIEYVNFNSVKPVYAETKAEETCTVKNRQGKEEEKPMTEVEMKMDSSKLKARPFMNQEKSWAKPVFKSDPARKQACLKDTEKDVATCKTDIAAGRKRCKDISDQCKEAVSKGGTLNLTVGGKELTAKDSDGCGTITTECNDNEKLTIDNLDILNEKDCAVKHVAACMKRKKDSADNLLKHEQGHFDVTKIIAGQLEAKAKELIDKFAGEKFKECKKEEALKKAKAKAKSTKAQIDELLASVKTELETAKAALRETQDRYDSGAEADHSKNVERQAVWNSSLAEGTFPGPPEATTP